MINASVINSGPSGLIRSTARWWDRTRWSRYSRDARADRSIRRSCCASDSPGGSSTASDVICASCRSARTIGAVIVSMLGLAASGGICIALGGDAIVAQPGTLDRSDRRLHRQLRDRVDRFEKLGANMEATSRGHTPTIYRPIIDCTPDERRRSRNRCSRLRPVRSSAPPRRGTCRPRGRRDRAGARLDGRAGRTQRARSPAPAGSSKAVDLAKQRARIAEEVELVVYHRAEASTRCWRGTIVAGGELAGGGTRRTRYSSCSGRESGVPWPPSSLPRACSKVGQVLVHMPYVCHRVTASIKCGGRSRVES